MHGKTLFLLHAKGFSLAIAVVSTICRSALFFPYNYNSNTNNNIDNNNNNNDNNYYYNIYNISNNASSYSTATVLIIFNDLRIISLFSLFCLPRLGMTLNVTNFKT